MSRASARGSKDKEKTKPQPVPLSAISPEIVPGKFTENDWINMLEKDSAEDFILDFVDEVLVQTMGTIYKQYLRKQAVPFTIFQARNDMLHIVEWYFLDRDEGEMGTDEDGWVQDEEPDTVVTDCWAQGSVPKLEVEAPSFNLEEMSMGSREKTGKVFGSAEAGLENKVSVCGVVKRKKKNASETEVHKKGQELTPTASKTKRILKPHGETSTPSAMTCTTKSLEQTQKVPETQKITSTTPRVPGFSPKVSVAHRRSVSKGKYYSHEPEVQLDEMGSIVSFTKLEPDTLPHHQINVRYHVVDPSMEAKQKGFEAMRVGQAQKGISRKNVAGHTAMPESLATGRSKSRRFVPIPCPPSILESISVVEGVMITEAGRTKKTPRRVTPTSKMLDHRLKDLHPVTSLKDKSNAISASDLLECPSPILRSLDENKPLPPILPASANRNRFST